MSDQASVLVHYDGKNQHSVSGGPSDLIRLNPGNNKVDAEVWDRIVAAAEKESKKTGTRGGVLYLIDNDLVTIIPADEDGGLNLDLLNAGDAIRVVESELDLDNLNKMLETENNRPKPRATVLKAITGQIIAIEDASGEE